MISWVHVRESSKLLGKLCNRFCAVCKLFSFREMSFHRVRRAFKTLQIPRVNEDIHIYMSTKTFVQSQKLSANYFYFTREDEKLKCLWKIDNWNIEKSDTRKRLNNFSPTQRRSGKFSWLSRASKGDIKAFFFFLFSAVQSTHKNVKIFNAQAENSIHKRGKLKQRKGESSSLLLLWTSGGENFFPEKTEKIFSFFTRCLCQVEGKIW